MFTNPSQIIVLPEDYHRSSLHGLSAHHRDFPEVHGAGSSPKDAAALRPVSSMTLDNAPSDCAERLSSRRSKTCGLLPSADCS